MGRGRMVGAIAAAAVATAVAVAGLVGAPVASAFSDPNAFESPSHNIACSLFRVDGWTARCDIKRHDWPNDRRSKSCQLDYGDGLVLPARGRAHVLCAGDAGPFGARVLPYGHSIRRGDITCTSLVSGVRCERGHPRHGFLIARTKPRLY